MKNRLRLLSILFVRFISQQFKTQVKLHLIYLSFLVTDASTFYNMLGFLWPSHLNNWNSRHNFQNNIPERIKMTLEINTGKNNFPSTFFVPPIQNHDKLYSSGCFFLEVLGSLSHSKVMVMRPLIRQIKLYGLNHPISHSINIVALIGPVLCNVYNNKSAIH